MRHRFNRPNLCLARDMFVFSTFTGLCHADLTRLSDEHIVQAADGSLWIEIKRQKTGTDSRIRLLEIPLQIMEKYRPQKKTSTYFMFTAVVIWQTAMRDRRDMRYGPHHLSQGPA